MTVVETTHGRIRGRSLASGVTAFLGIPYGASTAGVNRFRPPQPLKGWTGVRTAYEFGPSCAQPPLAGPEAEGAVLMFGGRPEPSMSEDCLRINVWTPAADAAARPVLVYLHGGGHSTGSASWPVYDGAAMAGRDVVVVTVNHRLGILGYLSLGHLLGERYATSGASGMLDVVAALEWVRDNIEAFGGDPRNVTVFGQSGGGSKVAMLLAMPRAAGLFHRAVIMSGWFGMRGPTPEVARERTAAALGLLDVDAAALLTAGVQQLVDASAAMGGIDSGLYPVVDGEVVESQPVEAVRAGTVPLLIGTVRDEYSMFLPFIAMMLGGDPEEAIRSYLVATFGARVAEITARYAQHDPSLTPSQLSVAVATDGHVLMPAIELAEAQVDGGGEVFMYRFDYESPLDPSLGAAHGLDVPFVFDTTASAPVTGAPGSPAATELATQLCDGWVAFARGGQPELAGQPWPRYTREARETVLLTGPVRIESDPAGVRRRAWTET